MVGSTLDPERRPSSGRVGPEQFDEKHYRSKRTIRLVIFLVVQHRDEWANDCICDIERQFMTLE